MPMLLVGAVGFNFGFPVVGGSSFNSKLSQGDFFSMLHFVKLDINSPHLVML